MTPKQIMEWLGLEASPEILPIEVTLGMANVPVPQDDLDHIAVFRIYLALTRAAQDGQTGNDRRL